MKKSSLLLCITILGFSLSCNKEDLNKLNPNEVVVESFFKSQSEIESALFAVYAAIQRPQLYGREYFFTADLRSDEVTTGGGQLEASRNQLLIGANGPANAVSNAVWFGFYLTINRANLVLDNAERVEDISNAERQRIIAEAKFARGYAYSELAFMWGGVPIYTSVPTTPDESSPKATREEVFAQALQDFADAAAGLPTKSNLDVPGRFTRGAALNGAARVHMFQGNYGQALTVLNQIVDSGEYSLVAEYDDNFQEENEFNAESLFEIGFATVGDFAWGESGAAGNQPLFEFSVRTQEYSAIGWRNLIPSKRLVDEFELPSKGDAKRDPRLDKSFYFVGDTFNNGADVVEEGNVQGNTILFQGENQKISWRKYSVMYKSNPGGFGLSGINMRVMRYAEVLLNLAESELEAGDAGRAIALLNQVRQRPSVDMPPYPTANYPVDSPAEILRAIQHEKMVELSSEQVRYRDILRWRAQGKLASEPFDYFTPNKSELLPIPQEEIDNNASLSQSDQNPGY